MADQVRWGVIGSGGIARRRTIPEGIKAADNAVLTAVYDVNEVANREVAAQFGAQAAVSLEALLKLDLDAVYLATPASLHCAQTLQAAKARKHVMCEKPLGMTMKEALQMEAACNKAGVKLGTAFMMRFLRQHVAALELIRNGSLGQPVYGRAQLSCWYPPLSGAWRQDPALGGGGSLIDMGGHCIDLLEMFFGPVKEVSCFINNSVQAYASEDSAVAMLRFANGAIGTVDTFFCIPDNSSKNVLELYGSKGSILAQGTIGQGAAGSMVAFLEGDAKGYDAQQQRAAGAGLTIAPPPINTYRAEIEEFSRAILENRAPANSVAVGIQSQNVLAACYKSARTGKAVAV